MILANIFKTKFLKSDDIIKSNNILISLENVEGDERRFLHLSIEYIYNLKMIHLQFPESVGAI